MPILSERCSNICNYVRGDYQKHRSSDDRTKVKEMAEELAKILLDAGAVNTTWEIRTPVKDKSNILPFLPYLSQNTKEQLLEKGLDLNHIAGHSGVTPLTFDIGNSENDSVNELLKLAQNTQTAEQRAVWINTPDKMKDSNQQLVAQTPLQLTIAKGYREKNGSGYALNVSNIQLAEQLLKTGADQSINYQEPRNGNTALHLAYARKDMEAVMLLKAFGAQENIKNKAGQTPSDLLSLSYKQAEQLMKFHTSPDDHPKTFELKADKFEFVQNMIKSNHLQGPLDNNDLKDIIFQETFEMEILKKIQQHIDGLKQNVEKNPKLKLLINEVNWLSTYANEMSKNRSETWLKDFNLLIDKTEQALDHAAKKANEPQNMVSRWFKNLKQAVAAAIEGEIVFLRQCTDFLRNPRESFPQNPITIISTLMSNKVEHDKQNKQDFKEKARGLKEELRNLKREDHDPGQYSTPKPLTS